MAKEQKKTEPKHVRDFQQMADEDILTQVLSDYRASEANQTPFFEKFKRYYKMYRSYIDTVEADKRSENGRSNLFIPYAYHLIETIVPKMVLTLFNARPYVQTMPLGLDSDARTLRSKKMNKLLDYQFQQKIKLVPAYTDVVKTIGLYGTAITMQTWSYKEKQVIRRKPKTVMGITIPGAYDNVVVKGTVEDDPKVTIVPLLDFFYDPIATDIKTGRYCIYRSYADWHELNEKNQESEGKIYKNLDLLKDEIGKSGEGQAPNGESANPMLDAIGLAAPENGKKQIELLNYWMDDWVIIVANRKYVIYSQMNPYFHREKPFTKHVAVPVPNEFYGIGDVESIESLQAELNSTRNQRIDNVSFCMNKMWKIKRGANIDTTQLISRPAGFIEVDEAEDIEEIKFNDVTSSGYNEETAVKSDMDRTTGVFDSVRGSAASRRETATTMSILSNAGTDRFKLKTMLLEYGGLHDMITQIIQLNQQYIDHNRELILLGDNGVLDTDEITPEEIMGSWTIVAVGSAVEPIANPEQRQAQLVQLVGMINSNPMFAQQVNMPEILKLVLESFNVKNIDKYIIAPPQTIGALPMAGQQGIPQQMMPGGIPGMMGGLPNGQ
jgi:hypothetical protein